MEQVLTLQKKAQGKKFIVSYYPENLKLVIDGRKKIEYKNINLKSAYLIDIMHNFIRKYNYYDKNLFNMDSRILKKKYGKMYSHYLDFLIEHKIIKMFSNYKVGMKSKTYQILPRTLENIIIYENADNILLKKYKEIYSVQYLKKLNYQYIDEDIMINVVENINRITIKYDEAINYINNLDMPMIKDIKNRHSVKTLHLNDIWYKFDDYGRFHSNLTTLRSHIRKNYILIDGEPSKELDIANSQPIFLTRLMKNYLDSVDIEEYNSFKMLVLHGKLYQFISEQTGITDKGKIKEMTFRVFFGKNNPRTKGNKIFKEMFPSIFEFIINFKKSRGTHKALSYELQRSESNMLFNNILRDVINTDMDIPFFTVHDSICVKESDYDIVKDIFDYHIDILHKSIN